MCAFTYSVVRFDRMCTFTYSVVYLNDILLLSILILLIHPIFDLIHVPPRRSTPTFHLDHYRIDQFNGVGIVL